MQVGYKISCPPNKLQHFFLVAYSNDETYSLTKAWLITALSTCMGNSLPNCGTSTFSTIINSNTVVCDLWM